MLLVGCGHGGGCFRVSVFGFRVLGFSRALGF